MKMNKTKARKLMAIVEMLNKKAESAAISKSDIDKCRTQCFTAFYCEITGYDDGYLAGEWFCCFTSQKMTTSINDFYGNYHIGTALTFGGDEPTTVYLYNDNCKHDEFSSVIRFIRSLLKNDGINNMKFGTIKVVSEMIDYLDFDAV